MLQQSINKAYRPDPHRQEKHCFAQDCFNFHDIFSYINEMDTSSPDSKHKYMLEDGAPPDKFGVQYHLHIASHDFNSRINVLGSSHFGSWCPLNFLQMLWEPLRDQPKIVLRLF